MTRVDLNMGVESNTIISESKYQLFVKLYGEVPCLKCIVRSTCYNEHEYGQDDFDLEFTVPIDGIKTTAIIPYNELKLQYPYEPCEEFDDWHDKLHNFSLQKYRCFVVGTKIP